MLISRRCRQTGPSTDIIGGVIAELTGGAIAGLTGGPITPDLTPLDLITRELTTRELITAGPIVGMHGGFTGGPIAAVSTSLSMAPSRR